MGLSHTKTQRLGALRQHTACIPMCKIIAVKWPKTDNPLPLSETDM